MITQISLDLDIQSNQRHKDEKIWSNPRNLNKFTEIETKNQLNFESKRNDALHCSLAFISQQEDNSALLTLFWTHQDLAMGIGKLVTWGDFGFL